VGSSRWNGQNSNGDKERGG